MIMAHTPSPKDSRNLIRSIPQHAFTRLHLSKAAKAKRMDTSRTALNCMLESDNDASTLNTLSRPRSPSTQFTSNV